MVASALSKSLKDHAKAKTDEANAEKSIKEYILSVMTTSSYVKGNVNGVHVSSATAVTSARVHVGSCNDFQLFLLGM